ncbi:MAG: hypothetical protein ABIE74_12095 [Pseudomonadota bacterium]
MKIFSTLKSIFTAKSVNVADDNMTTFGRKRSFPKGSSVANTIYFGDDGKPSFNNSEKVPFIGNSEITYMNCHPDDHVIQAKYHYPLRYGKTEDGRHVMQQLGTRGCVAASYAMLALDQGVEVNWQFVMNADLARMDGTITLFEQGGLFAFSERLPHKVYSDEARAKKIKGLTDDFGPALIGIGGEIGSHCVVLDSISLSAERAIIRDPYHGWSIEITLKALLDRGPSQIVNVVKS